MTLNDFPISLVERLVAFAETAGVTLSSITWENGGIGHVEVWAGSEYDLERLLAVLRAAGAQPDDDPSAAGGTSLRVDGGLVRVLA